MPYNRTVTSVAWNNWTTTYIQNVAANRYVWDTWNDIGTTSTGANWYNDNAWTNWNNFNNRYATTTNQTWTTWVDEFDRADGHVAPIAWRPQAPAIVRSEEEWTRIREEQDRQRRIRDEAQKEARAEARKLMEVVLTKEQMNSYLTKGYFEVVGSEGGVFRIYHGTSGNLKQVVSGREVNALCVHPRLMDHRYEEEGVGYLPTEDSMIAQAFAIMHDELGTVQIANVHRGPRHLRAVPAAA